MGEEKLEITYPTNRAEAKRLRTSRYFTSRACKHGHVAARYTSSGVCLPCAVSMSRRVDIAERSRERVREWRKANLHRARQSGKRWKKSNRTKTRLYSKKWRERHGQELENKQKQLVYRRRQNNKQRCAWQMARECRKISATPPWADMLEIRKFYEACPDGYHVDHIIPLSHTDVCGLHVIYNLQYLTAADNIRKKNKLAA